MVMDQYHRTGLTVQCMFENNTYIYRCKIIPPSPDQLLTQNNGCPVEVQYPELFMQKILQLEFKVLEDFLTAIEDNSFLFRTLLSPSAQFQSRYNSNSHH